MIMIRTIKMSRRLLSSVTMLALVLIPTAASAHAGNSDPNVVHACIGNSLLVRIVGVSGSCRPNETPLHWDLEGAPEALFTQQDVIQSFDFNTGAGRQLGTATGKISGTTSVAFDFSPSGPPVGDALPIVFSNKVIVTDLDGDQIFFDNNGTGTFHLGVPGAPFQGSGGPMVGTYVVTGGTGKYAAWTVGKTYSYRAIFTNISENVLGSVYVEVR